MRPRPQPPPPPPRAPWLPRRPPPPLAPPAEQVATALARLSAHAGRTQLDLSLQPAELGHVAIRIARGADGAASVTIHVERPETLTLLHRDAPQLQAALDRAGVASDGRSVTVALAPREAAAPDTATNTPATATPSDAALAFGGQGRTPDGQPRGRPARPRGDARDARTTVLAVTLPAATGPRGGPSTDALDITA